MSKVPLGLASYSRDAGFAPEVVLKNFYIEADDSGASLDKFQRIQRAGCAAYQTVATGTSVRGLFRSDGILGGLPVAAIGTSLYTFNGTTSTAIGAIEDDGLPVQMTGTGGRFGIVTAGVFHVHDGTTFTTVALPTGTAQTITALNGYFIVGIGNGVFYWLIPGALTIDALDYATAESKSDSLVCALALRSDVFFFGTETIEVWQPDVQISDAGDVSAIITPIAGRAFTRGCLSRDTVQVLDNTAFFVGDDGIVYRISNVPERVSTPGIEERIRKRTGVLTSFVYTLDGHPQYVLNIPSVGSFAYDVSTQSWAEYSSNGVGRWRAQNACTLAGGTVIVGDCQSGKVFRLDPSISTDDGVVFDRVVTGSVAFSGHRVRVDRFECHMGCSAPTSLNLRWKDANGAWSPIRTLTADVTDAMVATYRLGAAKHPCRTFEVSCTTAAQVRISGALANEGRAN